MALRKSKREQEQERATRDHQLAARRRAVVQYRVLGLTYRAIGEKLGISHVQARADELAVRAEVKVETQETVEEMRGRENERLDMARSAIATQVLKGNLGAVDRWVNISQRAAKLNGLDKPVQFEDVTPPAKRRLGNLSVTELQLFEMLLQKVEGQPPSEDAEDDEE